MCSGRCVIVEGQECISCALAWDDSSMVSIWGCWVQFCDPSLPHFHHHDACNLPMVHSCRYLEMVPIFLSHLQTYSYEWTLLENFPIFVNKPIYWSPFIVLIKDITCSDVKLLRWFSYMFYGHTSWPISQEEFSWKDAARANHFKFQNG